jgi:hypothetical protein
MVWTSVVLPTPGPPVITSTLARSARRTASRWLSARVIPALRSAQGIARSGSTAGQGGRPSCSRSSRSAMVCSARYRPARNTHGRPATVSATTAPSASSRASASSTSSGGISSSPAAKPRSSSVGRPQWPWSIASASANAIPARARIMAVFSIPSRSAI